MALLFFGLPLICAATVLAIALHLCGREARWHIMLAAGLLGSFFIVLIPGVTVENIPLLLGGSISGAICGWIYWRIAIHGESPSGETSPS
jgi:Na+-translocating ferredoxin:NAD+ oxidoreductase RnfD subunit